MKPIVIDTSALIRFFTNDIPPKAQQVKKILDSTQKIVIPDVVFPELEYVLLGKTYNANRNKILIAFQYLVNRKNSLISQELKQAIAIYKASKLDIADCIIIAYAKKRQLLSFDNQLKRVRKQATT